MKSSSLETLSKTNEKPPHPEVDAQLKDFALASSINGVALGDLTGKLTYVNQAFLEMWGTKDPEEVIGKQPEFFVANPEIAVEVLEIVATKGGWEGDIEARKKNDELIWVHVSASLIKNSENQPISLMCSFVDITERKIIEKEMQIKDHAISSSINGVSFANLDGEITYVNDAFLKIWGGEDINEVLGKYPEMFAADVDQAAILFEKVVTTGGWEGEVQGRRRDGTLIWVYLSASLVIDENNEPAYLMSSFVDISERKKIEEEIRIKDFAVASSVNGVAFSDMDGKITYVNDAFLKMYESDNPDDVLGKYPEMFASNPEEAAEIFDTVIKNGAWEGEVEGRTKNGTSIWVYLSASLVKNEQDYPICMMCFLVDITRRRQIEEQARIKDIAISSSINGVSFANLDGQITYVNDAFMKMWGGDDPAEAIGKYPEMFAGDPKQAAELFEIVLTKGGWEGEIQGRRKDGSHIWVHLSASLVKNENNKPAYLMSTFVDITTRIQAELELNKAYENLEELVEKRTRELSAANTMLTSKILENRVAEKNLRQKEQELKKKSDSLEETNTALTVLLKRLEKNKDEFETKVLSNIKDLVFPYLEKLRITQLSETQKTYLNILQSNLNEIISPFLNKLSAQYTDFTPTQIQVAEYIRAGKSTKEIAEFLNISDRAVEFHRNNIRIKLGLKNKKINLRSYLMSLT